MTGLERVWEAIGRLQERCDILEREIAELRGDWSQPKPKQVPAGLECAGNVVCLPGVTLATVRRQRRRKSKGGRS